MKRDESLAPLSRQHHNALALCVRIELALHSKEFHSEEWQAETQRLFEAEIQHHFGAEEQVVFPVFAKAPSLAPVVQELLAEHQALRAYAAQAKERKLDRRKLAGFAAALAQHVRKEERALFEEAQKLVAPQEMAEMGRRLEEFLRAAGGGAAACLLRD